MRSNNRNAYSQRLHRVCDYIQTHLDGDLSLQRLSEVANFSRFHFHRLFSAHLGISVFRYIQLMRLKRASIQLAFERDTRIIDIAYQAGFENPESFSRAFKNAFAQTPSQFRQQAVWQTWQRALNRIIYPSYREQSMDIKIVDFPEQKVALLRHRGSHDKIYQSIEKFVQWRRQTGLSPVHNSNTYGIPYAHPDQVSEEAFQFDICGSVVEDIPDNPQGVINGKIVGGRYAVARHFGSHETIEHTVSAMYTDWLPESAEMLGEAPCFFHYLNLMPFVQEHELKTDVYLPLL